MKRKLLSFAVAFVLLLQTVASAGALYDYVQGIKATNPSFFDASNRFSWTNFVDQTYTEPTDPQKVGGKVEAALTGGVALNTSTDFTASKTLSSTSDVFDYKLSINMTNVKSTFNNLYAYTTTALAGDAALLTAFDNSKVKGKFSIEITYDAAITPPTAPILTLEQNGAPVTAVYSVGTPDTSVPGKIMVDVDADTTVATLNADPTLLNDLTIIVPGWQTSTDAGIIAKMDGNTVIEEQATVPGDTNKEYAIIEYYSNPTGVSVSIDSGSSGRSGRSSGGGTTIIPPITPTPAEPNPIDPDGEEIEADITENPDGTLNITPRGEQKSKKGKIPNGYSDKPYQPADPDYDPENPGTISGVEPNEDGTPVVLYPRYVNNEVPSAIRNQDNVHTAYISGYPDGQVKPTNNITREEVATAFYRLLDDDYRVQIESTVQNFPDVEAERWSNDYIATLANGKYLVGDTDGNFNPATPITRAEFAVIASKFAPSDAEIGENYFLDIDGHWAKDYILKVAEEYWISGYTDRTFNPDAYITRAEAMTIINRMLVRYGDVESEYAKQWPDVSKNDWYYQSVIEATTDHKYERKANGWSETWLAY